jgi:tripartite-type tricarboxylate transporter receptor subunit TctC
MTSTMPSLSRRAMLAMLAGSGLVRFSPPAFAQSYPDRPVKCIVAFAAGGPSDIIARLVCAKMAELTGKNFYVDNMGGGGGNIGMGAAARAQPDGLTMILAASNFVINPGLYKKITYDPDKDFIPITIIGDAPTAWVVHPSVPAKTVTELVDLIRKKPGEFTYASGGTGALPQLQAEIFKMHFNLNLNHAPHRSAGPAMQSVLGGHIPMAVVGLATVMEMIKDGQVRCLGVSGKQRFPSVPEIPTMKEQGVPGLEECNWQGFMLPAGTPKNVVDYLYREIIRAATAPGMREKLIELGYNPLNVPPGEFKAQIDAEVKMWTKVIKDANIELI